MTQFLSSQYWIARNAITFVLNAMGDPQKVSVSISSGAVVMAYMPGVEGLSYDNSHSYRRWRIRGYASVLKEAVVTHEVSGEPVDTTYPATGEKYVYILIPRNTQTVGEEAVIGFAPVEIDYLGYDANGVLVGSTNYYYLYTRGIISASVDSGPRSWSHPIETGTLATDEAYDAQTNNTWFQWDSVTGTVRFIKQIFMDARSWFDNLRASAISFVGDGTGTGVNDKGTVNCVANFSAMSDNRTEAIVTPKYLLDREAQVEQKYLRKDQNDETLFNLKANNLEAAQKLKAAFADIINTLKLGDGDDNTATTWSKGILQHVKFRDDFDNGDSWGIYPNGRMQLNTLEVRSSMKVLELIFNRLTATEGDYVFTESGTIEEVIPNGGNSYTLKIEKRNDTDFHAFQLGDVLRGVYNDLANLGGGQYFTSWMYVTGVDTSIPEGETERHNTITVTIYPSVVEPTDEPQVPGGVNYPPQRLMVLQRWGNNIPPSAANHARPEYSTFIVLNDDGTTYRNTRQACWYLSSIEKRIAMLDGVDAPIIREDNYTAFFGLPYNFFENKFKGHTMNPTQPYLYVRGAFLQDIHYIDYQGHIIRIENNRGVWTQENATNNPYVRTDSQVDVCYYNNRKWMCMVSQARPLPPSSDNTDWSMLYETLTPQYRIIPSVLQVLRNPDGTTSLVNNLITCDVVVDEGGDEPRFAPESEVEVYIGVNGDTPTHVSPYRQHTIAATDHSIEFYLWNKMSEFGEESELGDAIFAYLTGMVSVPIYERGSNGDTPTIDPETGNWIINGVVTQYPSAGDEGHSPYIGADGYWYEYDPSDPQALPSGFHKTIYYARGDAVIAQYSVDCIDWYDAYFEGALWMRTKNVSDANWGDPFRCVGEKGDGADYVESDFAISAHLTLPLEDGITWSDAPPTPTAARPYVWMRQMKKVWDAEHNTHSNGWQSYKFTRMTGEKGDTGATGETGPQGPQGVGGSYTLTEYGISASRTNPSDVGNNWAEIPPVTDYSHPYLWARLMLKEWSTATSQYVDAWQTYKYVLLTGPDGLPGRTSKPLRGPSEWNSLSNYLSGTGNELVQDIVYHPDYPSQMFLCMVSHSGVEPNENTTRNANWDAEHPWAFSEYREFTATKVLFAVRGRIENADIDDATITNVTIKGTLSEEMLDTQAQLDAVTRSMCPDILDPEEDVYYRNFQALNIKKGSVFIPYDAADRNKLIFLPRYIATPISVEYGDSENEHTFTIPAYTVSGTHLTISVASPPSNRSLWSQVKDSSLKSLFGGTSTERTKVMNIYGMGVLICADALMFTENNRTLFGGYYYGNNSNFLHGRFAYNGVSSRFIFLMPGQTLHLISVVENVNGTNCLTWYVQNASDFEPLSCYAVEGANSYAFYGEVASPDPQDVGNTDNWQDMIVGSHKINPLILLNTILDPSEDQPVLHINKSTLSWYWAVDNPSDF